MAKREKANSSSKGYFLIVFVAIASAGGWWFWQNDRLAEWKDRALHYVENRDITTLESRYLPDQIIEAHRKELFGNDKRTLQNTVLKYYPYLLLDIKYIDDQKTREGVLLWGLNDGEMVLNTDSWETTHGFRDCLECGATREDFKILHALAKRQGTLSIEDLQKELRLERDVLDSWIEGAKRKHLIVEKVNQVQLHFENPKLVLTPQTRIKQQLVSKPLGEGEKVSRAYSRNQIIGITQAAFGNGFKIRSEQEVYLPVYSLEILNPDGSIQMSEWNALTGQQILPRYLTKG